MQYNKEQQNLIYFYDLPKSITSTQLGKLIKEKAKVDLDIQPQIKRDIGRHFYTAIVKINDTENFKKVQENLKYPEFDLGNGKIAYTRSLAFNPEFLGTGKLKLVDKNVFVKNIPQSMTPQKLDEYFSKYGDIISVKISLNKDHESNGYGFVCYQKPEFATAAIQATCRNEECQGNKFAPRDKRDIGKIYNNLYVKNFPLDWDEQKLRTIFEKYGEIKSCVIMENTEKALKFGFVCYEKEGDKNYGHQCAAKAAAELHLLKIDENHTLYCRQALSLKEREAEKLKEMIRYKNSKKRCNLYVKNFPGNTTQEQLKDYFSKHGEIESIKLFQNTKGDEALYAFVCFKKPEEAANARQQCHQQAFMGKTLYINFYEIKEVRSAQYEEMHDKTDWQNWKKQSTNVSELMSRPDIYAILQQLLTLIQPRLQQRGQQQRKPYTKAPGSMPQVPGGGPRQNMPNPMGGQQMPMPMPGGMPGQMPGQMPQQMNMPPNMPNQPMMGMMPPRQVMPPTMQGMPMQPGMPGPMIGAPPNIPPIMQNAQLMMSQNHPYYVKSLPIISAVSLQNPNYKSQVGEVIFEFVEQIAGEEVAPKITGMLIDLPLEEIKQYLLSQDRLIEKVKEAENLLRHQEEQ